MKGIDYSYGDWLKPEVCTWVKKEIYKSAAGKHTGVYKVAKPLSTK